MARRCTKYSDDSTSQSKEQLNGKAVEWMEKVTDEQYRKLLWLSP